MVIVAVTEAALVVAEEATLPAEVAGELARLRSPVTSRKRRAISQPCRRSPRSSGPVRAHPGGAFQARAVRRSHASNTGGPASLTGIQNSTASGRLRRQAENATGLSVTVFLMMCNWVLVPSAALGPQAK